MSETAAIAFAWTCSECHVGRTKPKKRLPTGWKRRADDVYCDTCWRKQYLLRAIAIPVVEPLDLSWTELRPVLKEMWAATTQASNWMLTELYARDVRRTNEEKMPPMPSCYLYPEARQRFPQLPSSTIATLEQQVKAKYRAKRYEVVWIAKSSLPTYRYPTPFPVPNQTWSLEFEEQSPVVSLRVGEQRIRLRLKGGARYRRQRAALEAIASGHAVQGQMDLYQKGDDLLCKMVAWLPRAEQQRTQLTSGVLYVRSAADAMIVALDAKAEKLWTFHGNHIPRWSAEHRQRLQNWSDDSKAELRPVVPFQARREESAIKYRNRMNSACHEIAAMVVAYAKRRHYASVQYADSDQSFCPQFPWFNLRQMLREKCDAAAISFEHTSDEATANVEQPLDNSKTID